MSQSHGSKGETTDKAFQVQCLLWETRASVGEDLYVFTLSFLSDMHKSLYKKQKERGKK